MRYLLAWTAICTMTAALHAGPAGKPAGWGPREAMVGDWTGEGGGRPGQGTGSFSFQADLQGKILVRKNRSEYPATKEHPAFRHDDLMVVYRDEPGLRAMYFDSEGHAIRYDLNSSPNSNAVTFVSAVEPSGPRYRLTYTPVNRDRLKIKFEIAPPGHPEEFATYIEAGARRVSQ